MVSDHLSALPGVVCVRASSGVYELALNDGTSRAPTDDELKAAVVADKTVAVKAERDRRKFAGYVTQGHRFHSDADSRTQQIGLVLLGANIPAGLMWKTLDGDFVAMTQALAGAIFTTAATADTQIFAAAEQHITNLNACATAADALAYDILSNWPVV